MLTFIYVYAIIMCNFRLGGSMENYFQSNLKKLTKLYSQRHLAEVTGCSQSSINNYLTKTNEPSMQFLIALNREFGISIDDFLFKDLDFNPKNNLDKYVGNYIVYYYNNNSYKGEVHTNLQNTLNYGVISVCKEKYNYRTFGTFFKNKEEAIKLLKVVNSCENTSDIVKKHKEINNFYNGSIHTSNQNIFIYLVNSEIEDECFIILNNPPASSKYIGGLGTINTVARGREHNPCVQFLIMSKKLIDKVDGEIYDCLKLDYSVINLDTQVSDLIDLFKRMYIEENELSKNLNESQKQAVIENNIKFFFSEIVEANMFRFAKVSNREDDSLYRVLKEGIDV